MTDIKVSVIVPVYNTEKYLTECLDSLLNQTLREIEILCVDDGSTDSSCEILADHAKKDERLQVFHQQNRYAGVARNAGLEKAQGEYVVFVDSDDFFDLSLLETAYRKAKAKDADIVLWDGKSYLDDEGRAGDDHLFLNRTVLPKKDPFCYRDLPTRILSVSNHAPWTKMFRRSFLLQEKIRFLPVQSANDLFFTSIALCAAKRITYINESLVFYRMQHAGSISGTRIKHPLCFLESYQAVYDELVRRQVYQDVKISFENIVANGFVWEYNSIQDKEAQAEIIRALPDFPFMKDFPSASPDAFLSADAYDFLMSAFYLSRRQKATENARVCKCPAVLCRGDHPSPAVSVVIPVYNVASYLEDALRSVINQTFKEIELICVNDGSTDHSLDILLQYAKTDSRITVLSQENGGPSCARNAGASFAQGEYLYFLDSDDMLEATAMEELYGYASVHQLDVLYFDSDVFFDNDLKDDTGNAYQEALRYYHRQHDYRPVVSGASLFRQFHMNNEYCVSACLQFIRREYYVQNHLQFCNGILHEDNAFTFECILRASRTAHLSRMLYRHRLREGSIMSTTTSFANAYGYFKCAQLMIGCLEKIRLNDDEFEAARQEIESILCAARIKHRQLSAPEKASYAGLPPADRLQYQAVVVDYDRVICQQAELQKEAAAKRSFAYLPRKLYGGVRCIKDNGVPYTLKLLKRKVQSRIRPSL